MLALMLPMIMSVGQWAAEQQSPDVVRIFKFTMSGYTCTALTRDHNLEQVRVPFEHGIARSPEIRVGSATDEDIHNIEQLVAQPQIREANSDIRFPSGPVTADGKWFLVLTQHDGKLRSTEFIDTDGKRSMPDYLKRFDSFADAIRHRRLPKTSDQIKPLCTLTIK
jgi:hypothetical protein